MALTADKKLKTLRPDLLVKRSFPADAATYYVGEIIMVGAASNTAKAISGSTEPATQVVGVVTKNQVIANAGDKLEVSAGHFVMSGSGFTQNEVNKLAWAQDSTTVYDAQGSTTNGQVIGRFRGFSVTNNGSENCVIEVGNVVSGTAA
jgi:hypothetical protein